MRAFKLTKLALITAISIGSIAGAFAYMGQPGPNPNAPQYNMNGTATFNGQGAMNSNAFRMQGQVRAQGQIGQDDIVQQSTLQYVMQLPKQELDEQEKEGILHMREEEKLARDVYLTLYEKWGLPIFRNIARSEQNHMDAVKVLIEKYGLEDPVEEVHDEVGKFVNPEIQQLYNQLVEEGSKSLEDALKVGATIEDLDIKDLEEYASETDNADIKTIYNNLMKGSRNHLRAFTSQLESRFGVTYHCQYIPETQCQEIINSDWERGIAYGPDNKPLFNNTPMYANQRMNNQFNGNFQGGMNNGAHGNMGAGMGMHGPNGMNIEMIKQNKKMFMEQIRQRKMMVLQQLRMVKEKAIQEIRTRHRLDPQTKQEIINVVKELLMVKLQELLAEVVGTPLEDKYATQIQDLITKLQNATTTTEIIQIFKEYRQIKASVSVEASATASTQ